MKRLTVVVFALLVVVLAGPAYAHMEGMMGMMPMCPQMMGEGQPGMMGMMPMCQQMMGGGQGMMGSGMMGPGMMMGKGMMSADMMQMMMDMMDMQEKMMAGVKPEEKKMMMEEMGKMKDKMASMKAAAMRTADPMSRMKCAEGWMKKAIGLHEVHLKDPKTATEASQMDMMDQMKHAYECIGGGMEAAGAQSGALPAKDPHGH